MCVGEGSVFEENYWVPSIYLNESSLLLTQLFTVFEEFFFWEIWIFLLSLFLFVCVSFVLENKPKEKSRLLKRVSVYYKKYMWLSSLIDSFICCLRLPLFVSFSCLEQNHLLDFAHSRKRPNNIQAIVFL